MALLKLMLLRHPTLRLVMAGFILLQPLAAGIFGEEGHLFLGSVAKGYIWSVFLSSGPASAVLVATIFFPVLYFKAFPRNGNPNHDSWLPAYLTGLFYFSTLVTLCIVVYLIQREQMNWTWAELTAVIFGFCELLYFFAVGSANDKRIFYYRLFLGAAALMPAFMHPTLSNSLLGENADPIFMFLVSGHMIAGYILDNYVMDNRHLLDDI